MRRFDLVVIGCGQGADPLACAFAKAGKTVALIERGELGGSCVNWGCTPTKTFAASARAAQVARRGSEYGVRTGAIEVDFPAVRARKDGIVTEFRQELAKELELAEGLEIVCGEARFVGPRRLAVGDGEGKDGEIEGEIVVIDTGTRPQIPDIPGLKDVPYLTAAEALALDELPEHLIVLGGGYIGLEFAQSFRRFGAAVTIVEKGDRLLSREDPDVTDAMTAFLQEEGVAIECVAEIEGVAQDGGEIVVRLKGNEVRGSHLLVATSQTPNTEALDLAKAGVETDEKGYVRVDERLRTTADGVYAIGDVKGGPAFTHISYDDFRILRANLLEGGDRTTEGRQVPYCVFTDPPLGRIGLSESEAREKGVAYRVGKLPMSENGHAIEWGETKGFLKVLVGEDDVILGATWLGFGGGDGLAFLQIAMLGGLKSGVLGEGIFAHPTLAEALNLVFRDLKPPPSNNA